MNRLIDYIIGYYRVKTDCQGALPLINYMLRQGITYRNLRRCSDGGLELELSGLECEKITFFCAENGIKTVKSDICGFPALLRRYRYRVGIPAGVLIFVFMLWSSTKYIWRIDINGNSSVPSEKILSELETLGCRVGERIDKIDFFELCNSYIATSEDIAWISVNLRGTVASVEVREQINSVKTENTEPSNIVASRGGMIENIGSYSGTCIVQNGETVVAGQLLISGFQEERDGSVRLERASGYIMAHTAHSFEVSIPYKNTEKSYTGNVIMEKTLNIFGKMIKLYKKTGNYGVMYDKIENKETLVLFDRIYLPFSITTVSYLEYEYREVMLSAEEAKAEAEAELKRQMNEELKNAELLQSSVKTAVSAENEENGAYTIICTAYCLENIAEERIISVQTEAD